MRNQTPVWPRSTAGFRASCDHGRPARLAKNWNYDQAAAAYLTMRGMFPAAANGGPPDMSAELLRQYELWPDGGAQPSALTLAGLAQLYGVEPEDLLDQRDRGNLPPADLMLLSQQVPEDSGGTSLAESVLGQATAALAFAAAVVYTAGGLSLGLKLWFMKVPWTPVLGQIPKDLIVVTAVGQVVLPCLIVGAAVGAVINWLTVEPQGSRHEPNVHVARLRGWLNERYWQEGPIHFLRITFWMSLGVGAVLGAVPVILLALTQRSVLPGVLQPWTAILACCGLLSAVAVFAGLCALRRVYGSSEVSRRAPSAAWRRAFAAGVAAVALVPLFCSVSGSFLLPPVRLCGQNFLHPVVGQIQQVAGYMKGNLIGTNSQWVYIAQFEKRADGSVYGATITAVPESAIDLQAIGRSAGCGDLVKK